jgi:hypothetical protein
MLVQAMPVFVHAVIPLRLPMNATSTSMLLMSSKTVVTDPFALRMVMVGT